MSSPIYLDYAATTPLDPRVAAIMCELLADPAAQGNPASATHGPGLLAARRVAEARAVIAEFIGARPAEIVFTSGATEANNLALMGVARAARRAGIAGHLVSSRTEHKSVLDTLQQLEREGMPVSWVEPDESGRVPVEAFRLALRPDTLLVSAMLANNEIGVTNDVVAIAALCRERGVLLHTDASQAVGKMAVDVGALGVDFLSFTAHKMYGPKGIGALYVREPARPKIAPVQFGGGHERGLRSGTLAPHQIAGFAAAASIAVLERKRDAAHAEHLAARLWRSLEKIEGAALNGHRDQRVPGILNVSFAGVEGESLVAGLVELAVSTGSACSSATREPSYVLRALGRDTELAQSSLRISFGRFTTATDVDVAASAILREVSRLRVLAGGAPIPDAPASLRQDIGPNGNLLDLAYSPAVRRYFLAPARTPSRSPGVQPAGFRRGEAGRHTDGTAVLFELDIADEIVRNARFTAYGCPHTLAVVAWLCEVLEGERADAARIGTPADWARKFEVPDEKLGRLLIVEDALRAALSA